MAAGGEGVEVAALLQGNGKRRWAHGAWLWWMGQVWGRCGWNCLHVAGTQGRCEGRVGG